MIAPVPNSAQLIWFSKMKKYAWLLILALSDQALADKLVLKIPGRGTLSFAAPQMRKLQESNEAGRYRYQATSVGTDNERFNLTVYVEKIDCHFGKSTKEVTRCFLEKSDLVPGVLKNSRSTLCREVSCDVTYLVETQVGEDKFVMFSFNAIRALRDEWLHVHFSATNPRKEDLSIVSEVQESFSFVDEKH
jgi:hypothetical protein